MSEHGTICTFMLCCRHGKPEYYSSRVYRSIHCNRYLKNPIMFVNYKYVQDIYYNGIILYTSEVAIWLV